MTDKTVSAQAVAEMDFGSGTSPFSFMSTTDWAMSDQTAPTTIQSQVTSDNDGEFIPDSKKTYGGKTDISANYESKVNTSITSLASVAVGASGAVSIDGISIATKQGAKATASVKAHKHSTGTHMARSRTVVLPAFLGWGASDFAMDIGIDLECIQAGSYDVSFGHVDQPSNTGDQLIGVQKQETHTAKFDYVSDSLPTEIEDSDSEWIMTNTPDSATKNRDGFFSGSVTYVKYVGTPITP